MARKNYVAALLVVVCLVVAMAVAEADTAEDQKCYDSCYNNCIFPAFLCRVACYDKCFLHQPDKDVRKHNQIVGTESPLPAPSMNGAKAKKLA